MKILIVVIAVVAAFLPYSIADGDCNKTSKNATGSIHYPSNVKKGDKCLFTIKVDDEKPPSFITLTMANIMLTDGGKLDIYDGDTQSKTPTLLQSISGKSSPEQISVTFSNNVNIQYTVGDTKSKSSWEISYASNECSQNVTNLWVKKIASPRYLPTKEKQFQCNYTVINGLPADRIPVVSAQLQLTDKSSLELANGQNVVIYTDKTPADDFFGTDMSEAIDIVFKVTDASTKPSFSLVMEPVIEGCSGKFDLVQTMSFNISILADHSAQYDCRGLFVTNGTKILAEVESSSLVEGYDFLRFMDTSSSSSSGKDLMALSSNPHSGYLVATTSTSLMVTLSLGNAAGKREMHFKVSPQESGGRFIGSGTLTAGKPKEDNNVETISAYFQLVALSDKVVSTQVISPLPENATLKFYDGLQTSDKVLAAFDSKTAGMESIQVIGGSEMLLVLEALPPTENFTASFDSIDPGCNTFLTEASGQLMFSNDASFNGTENCTLTIYPYDTIGDTLVLNFDSLVIGEKESVLIYSGDSIVAEFNAQNSQASEVYMSRSSLVKILIMNGGEEKTHTSLTGRYSVKSNVCGGDLTEKSGDVSTPNFPNQYPLNAECTWVVSDEVEGDLVTANDSLYLSFKSMDLVEGHTIMVSDVINKSTEVLASYSTSRDLPDDLVVPVTAGLNIKFSSPAMNMKNQVAGGAQISYMIHSCGGNMSMETGTFSSPGYPKAASESATCVWIIEVPCPESTKNGTNIVTMNITLKDKTAKTMSPSLKIYDGSSMMSSSLLEVKKVEQGVASQVLSTYSKVIIKYDYSLDPKTKEKAGFTLSFKTYKCNSSQMCDNLKCLHPDWKCNHVDDCGDNTDERNCSYTPSPVTPTPKPSGSSDTSGYVKGGYVALVFFIALILGAILVLLVPRIIRKLRGGSGGNYSRMHDNAPVVT